MALVGQEASNIHPEVETVSGGKTSEGNLPDATVVAAWPLNTPWNAVMVCSLHVRKLETGLMLAPMVLPWLPGCPGIMPQQRPLLPCDPGLWKDPV